MWNFFKPFLLNCAQLKKCNHKTIATFFNNSMSLLLWSLNVKLKYVLLFLTDAVPYMVKSTVTINTYFGNLIHYCSLLNIVWRYVPWLGCCKLRPIFNFLLKLWLGFYFNFIGIFLQNKKNIVLPIFYNM